MSLKKLIDWPLLTTEYVEITVFSLLVILFVGMVTFTGLKIVRSLFRKYISKREVERQSYWSVYLILRYVVWVIVIVLMLETLGVKVSILLASITALLVGVGFGIQQLFSDAASGVVLIFERNLQINDVIQLEDGTVGRVIQIGLRTSKLKTRDDVILVIPNSKFVNDTIINWSQMDQNTRFSVGLGVAYGSDTRLVTDTLLACALNNKHISEHPEPFVRFSDFGDSSLNFELFFWVKEPFRVEHVKSLLRYSIDDCFRRNGIEIPFPQRDLHIKTSGEQIKPAE